ncbi:MAG: TetR/AcrR family transcriptional regulator [Burkholderiales bacterium]
MRNPVTSRSEPRWARRKEARPEEITRAALELFVERGYAATRLEDVATRAGVAKGTVYLYFANKAELFKAVVREGIVPPIAEMSSMVQHFEGTSFELLRLMLRGWWERIGSRPLSGIPKLIIAEAGNFPEIARFYMAEVVEPGQAAIIDIVRRGIARGEFRHIDANDAALLIAAPMLLTALWRNSLAPFAGAQLDEVRLLEAHLDTLRRALLKDPDAAPLNGRIRER